MQELSAGVEFKIAVIYSNLFIQIKRLKQIKHLIKQTHLKN